MRTFFGKQDPTAEKMSEVVFYHIVAKKILVTAKAYLSATLGPNISDFFGLCLHWVSVARE